ncbi:MAG: glycoside hydrolase family 43 protein [Acidimicrobiales bacterium]
MRRAGRVVVAAGVLMVALLGASTPLAAVEAPTRSRLVYDKDHADPEVIRAPDGRFYTFSTNRRRNSVRVNVPVMMSTDLTNWTEMGDALWSLGYWATSGPLWAPSVGSIGENFVLYYTAMRSNPRQLCIGRAFSPTPAGPYLDKWTSALICPVGDQYEAIDPSVFVDHDGAVYLYYKTSSRPSNGTSQTRIWAVQLRADGLEVATDPMPVLDPIESWDEGDVENPEMIKVGDRYSLFYSASWWDTDRYRTAVTDCATPVGPCRNRRQVLVSDGEVSGPGGASLVQDSGGNWWIAYHAWIGRTRALHADPIDLGGRVPVIDRSRATARTLPVTGALDAAVVRGSQLRVSGWAADRDDSLPVRVQVVVDDQIVATLTADEFRSDVRRLDPALGASHGFDTIITLASSIAPRRVCVNAIDDGVTGIAIGCRAPAT